MTSRHKIVFVSVDPKINDLEWKLPIIDEFVRSGYEVDVFLSLRFPYDCDSFMIYALHRIGANVFYNDFLDKAEIMPQFFIRFLRKISQKNTWGRLLAKAYFSSVSAVFILKKQRFEKAIRSWFKESSAVFLCVYPGNPDNALIRMIFEMAEQSGVKTIGIPLAVGSKWYYEEQVRPHDLILTSTMKEREGCASINPYRVECMGAAQFDLTWLKRFNQYYQEWQKESVQLPSNKNLILVIMTSEIHPHWDGVDYYQTVSRLFQHLFSEEKNYILIKLHPRNNQKTLDRILKDFPKDSYRLVQGAIAPLVEKVDHVVSFVSLGSLFALPFKKVPYIYFPVTPDYKRYLDNGGGAVLKRLYLERSKSGSYQTNFNDYTHFVDDVDFKLEQISQGEQELCLKNFYRDFNPEGAANRIRILVESLMRQK